MQSPHLTGSSARPPPTGTPPQVPPQAHSLGGIQPAVGSRIRPSAPHPCSALDGPQSFRRWGGPTLDRSGRSSPDPQGSDPQPPPPHCRHPSKFNQVVLLSQPRPRLRGVPAPRLPASFLPSSDPSTHPPPTPKPSATRRVREDPHPGRRLQARGAGGGPGWGLQTRPQGRSGGARGLTCGAGARSSPPWAAAGGASSRLAAIRGGRPAPDRRARPGTER